MKVFFLLIFGIFLNADDRYPQPEDKLKEIIKQHLNSTTLNISWQDLKSISEQGKWFFEDGIVKECSFLRKWPGMLRYETRDSLSHTIIYENPNGTLFIEGGKKKYMNFNDLYPKRAIVASKFNFSYALSKIDDVEIVAKYMRDTLVDKQLYHIIKLKENGKEPDLLLIDSKTFYLKFVISSSIYCYCVTRFEDFKFVNGLLFPFKEAYYKFGKLEYTQVTQTISINDIPDSYPFTE